MGDACRRQGTAARPHSGRAVRSRISHPTYGQSGAGLPRNRDEDRPAARPRTHRQVGRLRRQASSRSADAGPVRSGATFRYRHGFGWRLTTGELAQ
jgi:hypothetical protein